MRTFDGWRRALPALPVLLLSALFTTAVVGPANAEDGDADTSKGARVEQISGVVSVKADGDACVILKESRRCVSPSNLDGLLRSGRVADGDVVTVQVVSDNRKYEFRGHVTVLK